MYKFLFLKKFSILRMLTHSSFFIIIFSSKFTHILGDVISEVHSVQTINNK